MSQFDVDNRLQLVLCWPPKGLPKDWDWASLAHSRLLGAPSRLLTKLFAQLGKHVGDVAGLGEEALLWDDGHKRY